jgi:hypothetical protein
MAQAVFESKFFPNPVQKAFIESRATADLFSSRMGEGKSAALCWATFYHARHNPGAAAFLIRDTWENLKRTTVKEFFTWFPPGVMGAFNQQNKEFTWAEGVAKGTVGFLGLDDQNDAGKLQSLAAGFIGMDEPAPAGGNGGIDEFVFNVALSRLRQPGMKWYGLKLAENNPDESHWTYRRFVDPGTEGFKLWQPTAPENEKNLPTGYYSNLRRLWEGRPDLQRRFLEGRFGFQQNGRIVTPEWNDDVHLAVGLRPIRGQDLWLCWDFGLNPTCLITQRTPLGNWNILHSFVGDSIGVQQLCEAQVLPVLRDEFRGFRWRHCGDPAGLARDPSNSNMSAVKMMQRILGGFWRSGPVRWPERENPARAILRQLINGRGLVQVDRTHARDIWWALRGGWHYHVAKTGVVSTEPAKDIHSHPGDAFGYGAAVLYPTGKLLIPAVSKFKPQVASAWSDGGGQPPPRGPLGFEQPGRNLPQETRKFGLT